ncbi:MAG: prolyl oligopeptidase family serine peptidase [Planctomycetota bacterium]|nr:prolyl oligopeptidase family serine peptidase [Planctomycetota bacterium]
MNTQSGVSVTVPVGVLSMVVFSIFAGCAAQRASGPVTIAPGAVGEPPPPTRVEPVTDTVHGVQLTDNFRWLEGNNSNPAAMGTMTDEVAAWTDAQNAYTRAFLDGLPGREAIEAELRPLMEVGSVSAPGMRGNRYFYAKREGNQNQPVFYWREGYKGEPRVLVDPAQLDATGLTTVTYVIPSHDGRLAAVGTYRSGDENTTVSLMDVDTGRMLGDVIPGKVSGVDWLPDGSGFVYRNLKDIANPYSGQIMFHQVGSPVSSDRLIFRQYLPEEDQKLATTYGPYSSLSDDGRWLSISYATDTRNNDLWVVDFPRWMRTGELFAEFLSVGDQAQSNGVAVGDTYYMFTTIDAPNGRIVKVDLNNSDRANWRTLVPTRDDAVIQGFDVAGNVLAVTYLKNASSTIELFDLDGGSKGSLRLPGIGSAGLSTHLDRTEAFLSFTSFNYPSTVFRVDLASPNAAPELWERPAVPVDPESVRVEQVWYPSKDGTKVSMFIISKKGTKRNADNPTILYGYGGFNVSITPSFSASLFQWLNAGGVYAVANLRGGGEYGEKWHHAGRLENKQNVFDDFASAAEYLIRENYTRPERLAIRGGSNGGLLTGTLVTQRPELFAAALVYVPLLDMIRFQDFLMAKYWVPEYGSAADPTQFEYILKYSPYQNIRPGIKYPAVLVTAGENDARVHPMHARKYAAALRAATASDPIERPVLLWVDREAGHGQGKPLNLRIREVADERIFLMRQLGMLTGNGR